jgi:serine/threonine-protein kinase
VSPDGKWVAFWASRTIRKIFLAGGPVVDVAPGGNAAPWGLVWGADNAIYWGRQDGVIWQIPADGAPRPITKRREGELWHASPWPLPGGRVVLYTVRKRVISWGDEEVVAQTIATGERKVLLRDATDARFVDSGHLLFLRRGALYAVPFDPKNLRLSGPEVSVVDPVGQYAVARTGALAWVAQPVVPFPDGGLVTVDRQGVVAPLSAPVHSYAPAVRLSRDGRRLAVGIQTITEVGLWAYDLERGTLTSLNRDGESLRPLWSGDGRRLFFNWQKDGRNALVALQLDASAPPVVVTAAQNQLVYPSSWSPDGRTLLAVAGAAVNRDIVAITTEGPTQVRALLDTPANEAWPELSRDGRWLAYGSDATSRYEVYIRSYPGSGRGEQVSIDGGTAPCWHPSGRELLFVGPADTAGRRRMMSVEFEPGPPPRIGRPRRLFDFDARALQFASGGPVRSYDLSADGQRFYAVETRPSVSAPPITHVDVITNWLEELKQKVPVKR